MAIVLAWKLGDTALHIFPCNLQTSNLSALRTTIYKERLMGFCYLTGILGIIGTYSRLVKLEGL